VLDLRQRTRNGKQENGSIKANTIALTDEDVAHKGAHDISLRRILTDLHTKGRHEEG